MNRYSPQHIEKRESILNRVCPSQGMHMQVMLKQGRLTRLARPLTSQRLYDSRCNETVYSTHTVTVQDTQSFRRSYEAYVHLPVARPRYACESDRAECGGQACKRKNGSLSSHETTRSPIGGWRKGGRLESEFRLHRCMASEAVADRVYEQCAESFNTSNATQTSISGSIVRPGGKVR